MAVVGVVVKISIEFPLDDHILNSHDLSDQLSIDIIRRNLILITTGP